MLHQPGIKIMTGAEENRHYLRAFIQMYRDLPVLWDTSLRDYTNREKRAEAYQRLVPIYHYLKRDANVEDVKKKINTLRTNYRKELKVVESALRAGNVHTPRCWTFQELDFLRNTEKFLAVNPNFKNEPFSFSENSHSSFMDSTAHYQYRAAQTPNISEMFHKSFGHVQKVEVLPGPSAVTGGGAGDFNGAPPPPPVPPPAKRARSMAHAPAPGSGNGVNTTVSTHTSDELLNIACDYLSGTYPEEESIARTWTYKLKRLPREQRLLAEKFVNEILFEAESGNLHRGSVQINNSFEPYVRFEEQTQNNEEQDKSQSPSVHTSSNEQAKANLVEPPTNAANTTQNENFNTYN